MIPRHWQTLTIGTAAVAALMLFAAPASAQLYENDYPYTTPYPVGGLWADFDYEDDLEDYYEEVEERADAYEDYSEYYEDDGWFDWF